MDASADGVHIDIAADFEEKAGADSENLDRAFEVAEQLADMAKTLAHVVTGAYAAGITAQRTPRGARVYAGDFTSAWNEFGVPAHGIPGQFVLRRAADALGLTFRKGG